VSSPFIRRAATSRRAKQGCSVSGAELDRVADRDTELLLGPTGAGVKTSF
jgi:hypothetical protein